MRHLTVYQRGAGASYTAHVSWLTARPWRSDLALLVDEADVAAAMAEADMLLGVLQASADDRDGPYTPGLAHSDDTPRRRLAARFRDPRQRAALRQLLAVDDDHLDGRAEAAFGRLIAEHENGLGVRTQPLFAR